MRTFDKNSFEGESAIVVTPMGQPSVPQSISIDEQSTEVIESINPSEDLRRRLMEQRPTDLVGVVDPTEVLRRKLLEEQPTNVNPVGPAEAFKRKMIEVQSTKIVAVVSQSTVKRAPEQLEAGKEGRVRKLQPRSSGAQKHRSRRVFLYAALLIILIVLVSDGLLSQFVFHISLIPGLSSAKTTPVAQVHRPSTGGTPIALVHSSPIETTIATFMQDMQQKDWARMWPMLAPDAQKLWQNEQDFTNFEQNKFGQLKLGSYKVGQAEDNPSWLDPDTTYTYSNVVVSYLSLQISDPSNVLTVPSDQSLAQGLFKRTLFALLQSTPGTWQVLVAGPADLQAPLVDPAKPPITHQIIPIFMYHHVSNIATTDTLDYSLTVTGSDFSAQLDWLQAQGYESITMTELFDMFYYGKILPPKPMLLTFDDGYADVYTYALPALLAHHYQGIFYIITWDINTNYLSWNEIKTLANSGMQIASHTVHHINIGQPPAGDSTQSELIDSKNTLQDQLNAPIQFFCYPTGEPFHNDTVAEQQIVLQDLFKDGYLGATLDPAAFDSALQNSQIPYEMPRIRVSGGEILNDFKGILASTLLADAQRLRVLG